MTEKKADKTNTKKKREAPISWRPPAVLRAEFLARVERSGLPISAFITRAVFSAGSPLEKALIARLLSEAAQIHEALHEIALSGGDTPTSALRLEAALDDLTEIRSVLIKAYGRQP